MESLFCQGRIPVLSGFKIFQAKTILTILFRGEVLNFAHSFAFVLEEIQNHFLRRALALLTAKVI